MDKKLQILYNTLMTIETKGDGTRLMAECLKYIENIIKESQETASSSSDEQ